MKPKFRRLARLERKLDERDFQRWEDAIKAWKGSQIMAAYNHMMWLGALMLEGEPKIDEPLEAAWRRCLTRFKVEPIDTIISNNINLLSRLVSRELLGNDPKEQLQPVLDFAPRWLLRFMSIDRSASVLELYCPDLSYAPRPVRTALQRVRGIDLPNRTLRAEPTAIENPFLQDWSSPVSNPPRRPQFCNSWFNTRVPTSLAVNAEPKGDAAAYALSIGDTESYARLTAAKAKGLGRRMRVTGDA
jgi:hypothetical protein